MPAAWPSPGGSPGKWLDAIGGSAALGELVAALGELVAALGELVAALGELVAALGELVAALRQQSAPPGQWQAGFAIGLGDRSPPWQLRATRPELAATPGERLSWRRPWLLTIGHADVS